jgi:epoxyqueuosine reductase QueG
VELLFADVNRFEPREGITSPLPTELIEMTGADFSQRFKGSAIRRAKHAGLRRNALAVN